MTVCVCTKVLEWDEFWRFVHDLELGLSDLEIAELRQAADTDNDGVVTWDEMVAVVTPHLSKIWAAKLAGAPEYDKWVQLHWETVRLVHSDSRRCTASTLRSCSCLMHCRYPVAASHRVQRRRRLHTEKCNFLHEQAYRRIDVGEARVYGEIFSR